MESTQRLLGVVLAGGQSRRFGSDKALAVHDGKALLTHAFDALSGWCELVVISGRAEGPAPCLPDWPRPGMGPLAGLTAALRLAVDEDFDAVLSCGVDSPGLPQNLPELLGPGPAIIAEQPVIGLWPARAAAVVAEAILGGDARHSMYALAEALGARRVALPSPPANVNFPGDLTAL